MNYLIGCLALFVSAHLAVPVNGQLNLRINSELDFKAHPSGLYSYEIATYDLRGATEPYDGPQNLLYSSGTDPRYDPYPSDPAYVCSVGGVPGRIDPSCRPLGGVNSIWVGDMENKNSTLDEPYVGGADGPIILRVRFYNGSTSIGSRSYTIALQRTMPDTNANGFYKGSDYTVGPDLEISHIGNGTSLLFKANNDILQVSGSTLYPYDTGTISGWCTPARPDCELGYFLTEGIIPYGSDVQLRSMPALQIGYEWLWHAEGVSTVTIKHRGAGNTPFQVRAIAYSAR